MTVVWALLPVAAFLLTLAITTFIYYGNLRGIDTLALSVRLIVGLLLFTLGPLSVGFLMYGLGKPPNRYEIGASILYGFFLVLFNIAVIRDSGIGPLPQDEIARLREGQGRGPEPSSGREYLMDWLGYEKKRIRRGAQEDQITSTRQR